MAHGIWKMTFYTPEPVSMVLKEAEQAGYGARMTSNRLVMRSPYNTAETYSEDVSYTRQSLLILSLLVNDIESSLAFRWLECPWKFSG